MMIKNKMTKKAVEPVVATVLLLLITVAAAGLIFGVIVPLIQNKIVEAGTSSCMTARVMVDTKTGFTCFNTTDKTVNVVVARASEDFKLAGLNIIVAIGGSTKTFLINQSLPSKNERSIYTVNASGTDPNAIPTEVGVAPIVLIGNIQQYCGITSSAKLETCI